MHSPAITVAAVFEAYSSRLGLEWLAGKTGEHTLILAPEVDVNQVSLIGHLNFIHPHRIQVLGRSESEYLSGLGKNSYEDALDALFSGQSVAVIVTSGFDGTPGLLERATSSNIPLLRSNLSADKLIDYASYYLTALLADRLTVHGVFMEVMGIGVLLTGESAVGKSELALELITRGHRLIADDVAEFTRSAPDTLHGTCPVLLRDFLEVRGLGLLNIRAMFGDSAIKKGKNLRLVVDLVPSTEEELNRFDRLHGSRSSRQILDVEIPEVKLPVAPGRNLAVLVEAAARNQTLNYHGYDAADDFIKRQRKQMESELK